MDLIYFETTSGTVYLLDKKAMTWERKRGKLAAHTRTDGGKLLAIPDLRIGHEAILNCPPIDQRFTGRSITTTPVVKIKEVLDDRERSGKFGG